MEDNILEYKDTQITQSESIVELAAAISKAQGQLTGAKKGSDNPFFKSKYADLAEVWDTARKPLSDNGLSVVQMTTVNNGQVHLVTQLQHSSGQFIRGFYPLIPTKKDPQGYGSAITYARRYCLAACVGIAQEDDDGNAASKHAQKRLLDKKTRDSVYEQTIEALQTGDAEGLRQIWNEFSAEEKIELWGEFSAKDRFAIKALQKL